MSVRATGSHALGSPNPPLKQSKKEDEEETPDAVHSLCYATYTLHCRNVSHPDPGNRASA